MNRRIATSAFALALTFCFTAASHAAVLPGAGAPSAPTTASVKVKLVSFRLRNDSKASLVVQMGDQQVTVAPGKTADVKAQEGTQVLAVNATGSIAAGSVLATVSKDLSGNTIAIN